MVYPGRSAIEARGLEVSSPGRRPRRFRGLMGVAARLAALAVLGAGAWRTLGRRGGPRIQRSPVGISNRPLDEELREQASLPPRGAAKR